MTPAHPAATDGALAAPSVVGLDLLSPGLREADHAVGEVLEALAALGAVSDAVVATHLTRLGPFPHVTLSVLAAGLTGDDLAEGLRAALPGAVVSLGAGPEQAAGAGAAAHAARTGGRAVHFPGVELLVGTLPLGEALAGSALDGVRLLGAGPAPVDPALPLVTRDHVRPSYEDGRLVLAVERGAGRTLVPFEVPDPTPCCADHA